MHHEAAAARSAGFADIFACLVLGFRFAPPQALRCHPLPRAGDSVAGGLRCVTTTGHYLTALQAVSSLMSQRHHRIDFRRSPRGNVASQQSS
jgi:hypothetical protein